LVVDDALHVPKTQSYDSFNDQLACGKPDVVTAYSSYYDRMKQDYVKDGVDVSKAELGLKHHLDREALEITFEDIDYELINKPKHYVSPFQLLRGYLGKLWT
jgi:hypothetical protein